ncbi:bifunctional diaminohydroxyphosphoribosylaminopyrimidine deaminase/5-amino-6-(5-phosphoribosylamino)uracil reductase RibD [Solidesulfovibrio sp.]|jgi:diaminohydroxyphosphoribosylaminopyrimidine deaminase/5-amino-6-(5-phosphoribosylamino)uracil reductase|uniref:bifunctional diaminohydroxyphosphoribosylaminopyrimidine deaminase/5-amino-6-(5-phosphoribosylamino)uracil reductase RibD n=1 Tax=Solidesulfovibrio sp. TaxID=2910990 RepID=UPI000EC6F285|nr:bifunctional diaminohydroxyphosphoribosylaminopyrimidine deaminase/5-amino-6-(5-phosphoribosylamino)uracil reductase RibD [Solidesulfovibrio sp.]MEA5089208.1 bifunctional diaminohydroxyphosphoribosylaminopyrimidine deaminase/5-amino-6-(5-phosphoribosylamino)uracil reductase RibD [Solidesulfovibrio sp.]HCR13482.1 bifunctional diaminohydroxyphosphoribosylaminopyrimidine deaminase/5-amino-6-(5-phosphoribosylamino)uracil reductase RibD [Desulfovibrio sp.]
MPSDAEFMARALELAERGRGSVTPNPRVGAVLVRDGKVLAEGWHKVFGGPHAEVECLRAAEDAGVDPAGATMYVTLEPCNHFGKTPPCSRTLLESGVSRVVIGCLDPNPVAGGGAELLRAGGVDVVVGVLEQECRDAIADFVVWKTCGRPFVTLKLALTLDGHIATRLGDSSWVSGETSRARVHVMRAASQAVMVGGGTLYTDNPRLTHRSVEGPLAGNPQPLAVVVTRRLPAAEAPLHLLTDRPGDLVLLTGMPNVKGVAAERLAELGIRVWGLPEHEDGSLDLLPGLVRLREEASAYTVLCEGGGGLAGSLLTQGLADELALFYAPKILGDAEALPAFRGRDIAHMADAASFRLLEASRCGEDLLVRARPTRPGPLPVRR